MGIYQPAEDSYLLQESVKKYAFGRVLDMGTGSGIQALTAIENPNVKEVAAVDIDEEVVGKLNEKVQKRRTRKIKVIRSDMFANVEGHFNTIIFNPPYLPQDKIGKELIEDAALYGGKHGWEISEKFFNEVSKYLFPDGKILFLFSSLTDKKKIEEIISNNLFEFSELAREKLPLFEELFVYLVEKSPLLRVLEKKGIEGIQYFTHGKRGNIFTGIIDRSKFVKTHFAKRNVVKAAIKVKRDESKAEGRVRNEARWLKILNKENIGPKLLFYGENYVVYEFVEGEFILDFIKKENNKNAIKKILSDVLEQCFILDKLKVNKEEMHHPLKHIIISKANLPVLIDFERCHNIDKPSNVTQFVEFICRMGKELEKKGIVVSVKKLRELAKEYKENIGEESLQKIIKDCQ